MFFILLSFSALSYSTQDNLQDLLRLLPSVKNDTIKVDLLNKIGWEFSKSDLSLTYYYSERSRILADWINYDKGLSTSFNLMGRFHYMRSDLKKMQEFNIKSLEIARRINDPVSQRDALNDLGVYSTEIGAYEDALEYFYQALEFAGELEKDIRTCNIYFNISVVYNELGDLEKSNQYLLKIKEFASGTTDIQIKGLAYESIAQFHYNKANYQKAIANYKLLYKITSANGDHYFKGKALIGLSKIEYQRGQQELAMIYLNEALLLYEEKEQINGVNLAKFELAKVSLHSGQPANAIAYIQEILEKDNEFISNRTLLKSYKVLSAAYAKLLDYDAALMANMEYENYFNNLFNSESARQIAIVEAKHQTQNKLVENTLLRAQQKRTEAQVQQRTTVMFGTCILLILSFVILILLKRSAGNYNKDKYILNQKVKARTSELSFTNFKLRQSNEELEQFAYIASHDLKEPLRNIVGFSNLLEKRMRQYSMINNEVDEYLGFIKNNAKQMYLLIEDVLEFSRISKNSGKEIVLNLNDIIGEVQQNISSQIKEKNVVIEVLDLPEIKAIPTRLFIVLKNLIENGIKYNQKENKHIKIYSIEKNGEVFINVEDNGIGIESKHHSKIFKMFERLHNKRDFQGTGLGLTICSKIISRMSGRLEVQSELGKGSIFSIVLPHEVLETPVYNLHPKQEQIKKLPSFRYPEVS